VSPPPKSAQGQEPQQRTALAAWGSPPTIARGVGGGHINVAPRVQPLGRSILGALALSNMLTHKNANSHASLEEMHAHLEPSMSSLPN